MGWGGVGRGNERRGENGNWDCKDGLFSFFKEKKEKGITHFKKEGNISFLLFSPRRAASVNSQRETGNSP